MSKYKNSNNYNYLKFSQEIFLFNVEILFTYKASSLSFAATRSWIIHYYLLFNFHCGWIWYFWKQSIFISQHYKMSKIKTMKYIQPYYRLSAQLRKYIWAIKSPYTYLLHPKFFYLKITTFNVGYIQQLML
jgi:hypothetical protein